MRAAETMPSKATMIVASRGRNVARAPEVDLRDVQGAVHGGLRLWATGPIDFTLVAVVDR